MNPYSIDLSLFPGDVRPVIKVLLEHEDLLTTGGFFMEGDDDEEIIKSLTDIARNIVTAVKTQYENQYPFKEVREWK